MNELTIHTGWARVAQMIFITTALSGSAACNLISGANAIQFNGPNVEENGGGGGGGGGGSSGDMMNVSGPTSSVSSTGSAGSVLVWGPPIAASGQIQCNGKDRIVGFGVHAGSWIDSIGAICEELKDDGTTRQYTSQTFGGPKGDVLSTVACESGQSVVELWHTHNASDGSIVYKVKIGCETASNWKEPGKVSYTSGYVGGINPGGVDVPLLTCAPGQVAAGLDVSVASDQSNTFVSNLGPLHCIPAP